MKITKDFTATIRVWRYYFSTRPEINRRGRLYRKFSLCIAFGMLVMASLFFGIMGFFIALIPALTIFILIIYLGLRFMVPKEEWISMINAPYKKKGAAAQLLKPTNFSQYWRNEQILE